MNKTELNRFRATLESLRPELESATANREDLAINSSPEDLDRIQHAGDRDLAMNRLERSFSRLREVRAALGRIAQGTFGICLECEEEISAKRLAAVPWTSLCIVCQEAADREQSTAGYEFEPLVSAA